MLARVLHSLRMARQTGEAALEISMANPQSAKSACLSSQYHALAKGSDILQRGLFIHVHRCSVHINQEMEAA